MTVAFKGDSVQEAMIAEAAVAIGVTGSGAWRLRKIGVPVSMTDTVLEGTVAAMPCVPMTLVMKVNVILKAGQRMSDRALSRNSDVLAVTIDVLLRSVIPR